MRDVFRIVVRELVRAHEIVMPLNDRWGVDLHHENALLAICVGEHVIAGKRGDVLRDWVNLDVRRMDSAVDHGGVQPTLKRRSLNGDVGALAVTKQIRGERPQNAEGYIRAGWRHEFGNLMKTVSVGLLYFASNEM